MELHLESTFTVNCQFVKMIDFRRKFSLTPKCLSYPNCVHIISRGVHCTKHERVYVSAQKGH